MTMIAQEELKTILNYNPDTGAFTWLRALALGVNIGDVVGYIQHGYLLITLNRKVYRAHRLAFLYMTGKFPENEIDHINHIKDDNRWLNLRSVTRSENLKNKSIPVNNTSGAIGIYWHKVSKKWAAQIKANGKVKYLGCFIDIHDAIKARKDAEVKYGFHPNHGQEKPLLLGNGL